MQEFPDPRANAKRRGIDQLSFYADVRRWAGEAGHRWLDGHQSNVETLTLYLENLVLDHGEKWISQKTGQYRLGFDDVGPLALEAATWAIETYRPILRRRLTVEDRRKGGRNSKRPSKLLEAYKALPVNLSLTQIAKALGCDIRTVSRLKQMRRAQEDAANQAILDAMDAEISAREIETDVTAMFEELGVYKLSDGTYYIPEPETVQ